jgi:hypothetical protein
MKKTVSIVAIAVLVGLSACSLFKPTPEGQCPQITTTGAELLAYGGALAAMKGGVPSADISKIAVDIDASVASGQYDGTVLDAAILKAGGQTWAPYLGGISILFGTTWQAALDGQLNAQVCTLPILQSASTGLKLAVAVSGKPATAKLAPFKK